MRKFLVAFFILTTFLITPVICLAQSTSETEEHIEATIIAIAKEETLDLNTKDQIVQTIEARLDEGPSVGKIVTITHGTAPTPLGPKLKVGDRVILSKTLGLDNQPTYLVTDYVRTTPLYLLAGLFILLTLIIARLRGFLSLIGMAASFAVIFLFVLPAILKGTNPILASLFASLIIIPISFTISHGLNKKTLSAIIGTVITLSLVGLLSLYFVDATKLSGFASEEAGFLQIVKQGSINIKNLLLAGIIISLLGVLDDITISQAAIVYQLKKANPKLKFTELYKRAMDVGKDHISSLVNTLILVYAGASLPLLILFVDNPHPINQLINYEIVATEIVKTLLASMGLIFAVPVTTLIASYFAEKED